MVVKCIMPVLIIVVYAFGDAAFVEDKILWEEIDNLNGVLEDSGIMDSEVLEEIFEKTVEIAMSYDLSQQFEDLRSYAFESDDYSLFERYAERAGEAITVLWLGESNAIGVNVLTFLLRSEAGSESYEFFQIAGDGFYVDGSTRTIGTAELPVWMERTGSSAQALIDLAVAEQWLSIWQSLHPLFDGFYLSIANETILGLGGDEPSGGSSLTSEELEAYYRVYDNPSVRHIRVALEGYVSGTLDGVFKGDSLLENLDSFRDYLDDSFVVLMINSAAMGGNLITLISQQKPDRIFSAWVYMIGNGEYELRGFVESKNFSPSEVGSIADQFQQALRDTSHSI
ncbi:MAG: hypothetical protein KAT09_02755 [Candidatus Aegiribacteria sp.]|nr:hypothetical protein [Candidatus Aegiribacteria sp.]